MNNEKIEEIQELRRNGLSYGQIAKKLLITKSQACYCCKIDLEERKSKQIDNTTFEDTICDLGKKCDNIYQICKILGKKPTNENYKKINSILTKNNVDISHFKPNYNSCNFQPKKDIKDYLSYGSKITLSRLKNKLIEEHYKERKCERCKNTLWEGQPIPLELHHINGNRLDNRIENLQILCPNCHTLTDNYCGRKLKKETNKCIMCGKEISRKATYCTECYTNKVSKKHRLYKNGLEYPSKEVLINDFIKLKSFSAVGLKYGVTDNTIRKWCESYSLPLSKTELKKYLQNI